MGTAITKAWITKDGRRMQVKDYARVLYANTNKTNGTDVSSNPTVKAVSSGGGADAQANAQRQQLGQGLKVLASNGLVKKKKLLGDEGVLGGTTGRE